VDASLEDGQDLPEVDQAAKDEIDEALGEMGFSDIGGATGSAPTTGEYSTNSKNVR
jgi:hypothetical protein